MRQQNDLAWVIMYFVVVSNVYASPRESTGKKNGEGSAIGKRKKRMKNEVHAWR